jgi:hypothetical protein
MRYLYGSAEEKEKGNLTLFVAVDSEEKVQTCLQAFEKVVGDLNEPNSGVFLAWPISFSKGITSRQDKGDLIDGLADFYPHCCWDCHRCQSTR